MHNVYMREHNARALVLLWAGLAAFSFLIVNFKHWQALLKAKTCVRNCLRRSKNPKFSGGACPRPPLVGARGVGQASAVT